MTETEPTETSLTVRRTFDASRERVYRAFAEPNKLEQWYSPGDLTAQVHTLELEPGGSLSLTFVGGESRTDIEGTFVEVVENERIVHTWQYPGEEESRVTYAFRDVDDGTEIVLTHEEIGPFRDRSTSENVDGYVEGWSRALEKLSAVVSHE